MTLKQLYIQSRRDSNSTQIANASDRRYTSELAMRLRQYIKSNATSLRSRVIKCHRNTAKSQKQLSEVSEFVIVLLGINNFGAVPSLLHLKSEINLLQNLFPSLTSNVSHTPYDSQLHDKIVTDEVSRLTSTGLVSTSQRGIRLTRNGKQRFATLKKQARPYTIKKIKEFKELLNDLERDELLTFMYHYPYKHDVNLQHVNYSTILPNRKILARSMYKKGKISAQKAAQIAEEYLEDFIKSL